MACNCGSHSSLSQPLNGELGFWPFDWLNEKATEFCLDKAYDHLTPIVAFIICIFVILFLGGRIKWV
ncbi:hypothetical protein [Leptospira borgpetersenii]|uniref:Uncharacterized protein n=2 Tax=Leptospira borgpetersenii TaxID=174 RepID=M3GSG6_LEPBO|nr:hypothetical protein [Leptospira borgpetersenii]EKP11608.1 hypothetical protein LEP1GSC128_1017 [Leptospira borgpetersenii str. 200801926]EMF97778.1 hypothetical protein LEP1GSC123_0904 [Leptospira borgpetersenii str. 200701203]ENO62791.1 hypothetical protein LEP1GSC191_4191 [Leptospira borgpetersenii serovar Mini str. 201000851]